MFKHGLKRSLPDSKANRLTLSGVALSLSSYPTQDLVSPVLFRRPSASASAPRVSLPEIGVVPHALRGQLAELNGPIQPRARNGITTVRRRHD